MAAKWRRSVLASILGLAVLLSSCAGPAAQANSAPAESAVAVKTAKVALGKVSATMTYPGNVSAKAQVNVIPKVAGAITKLNVDVGSQVKAGDVLAEIDSSAIQAQVAQAEAALAAAQARLATIDAGPRAEMVAQAEASAEAAQEKVNSLKAAGRPETIAAAQDNARAAAEKLASLKAAGRPETIAQAQDNLRAAQARLDQLKSGATTEQKNAAQAAVDQAQSTVDMAKAIQAKACAAGPSDACNAATLQLSFASTSLGQAKAQQALLTAPPTADQLTQAQAAVDAAAQQVKLAQSPLNSHDIAAAQAAVDAANEQVALAKNPVGSHDIAAAQAAADAAAAAAELAKQPFTDNDRLAAQAGVDQAQAAVDQAMLVLKDTTILAPFDGVVSQRYLAQGAMAAPTTPIVAIISGEVEVTMNLDEAKLGQVAVGQPVTITVAAYPGEQFPGKVVATAPGLDPRSRTRLVRIQPNATDKLLDGMYAQVTIDGTNQPQTLVVPAQAVLQQNGKTAVFVASQGKAVLREITTGARDDTNVAVVSGLTEGEEVVVAGQDRLSDGQAITVAN